MFTSLLKIGFITILSSLSPSNRGIVTRPLNERGKMPSVVETENVYIDYVDNETYTYFEIRNDDIVNNVFSSIALGNHLNMTGTYHVDVKLNGEWFTVENITSAYSSYTYNAMYWVIDTGFTYGNLWLTFPTENISQHIYYSQSGQDNINYDEIRIYRDSSYNSDYLAVIDSIFDVAKDYINVDIQRPISVVLGTQFNHTVDFFLKYGSAVDGLIKVNFNLLQASNEYSASHGYVYWSDDDNLLLHTEGTYRGNFDVDSYIISQNQYIQFKGTDSNLFREFRQAFLADLNANVPSNRYSFAFNDNFNYNAPFNGYRYSPMVYNTSFDADNEYVYITYNLPIFESNKRYFNAIQLLYVRAKGRYIYDDNQNPILVNDYNYGYFVSMSYKPSDSSDYVKVFNRNFDTFSDGVDVFTVPTNDGSWVNKAYQSLYFVGSIFTDNIDDLSKLNEGYEGSVIVYTDNYLGESFNLINMALSGIAGFFNIRILPGIAIGAIILVPFGITMLIFIIKLFKR